MNPEITRKSGSEWGEEGCLSFPGIYGDVLRAKKVWVTALDLDGKRIEFEAEDLYARVLQHEIDHLDGILFVSKMRPGGPVAEQEEARRAQAPFRVAGRPRHRGLTRRRCAGSFRSSR